MPDTPVNFDKAIEELGQVAGKLTQSGDLFDTVLQMLRPALFAPDPATPDANPIWTDEPTRTTTPTEVTQPPVESGASLEPRPDKEPDKALEPRAEPVDRLDTSERQFGEPRETQTTATQVSHPTASVTILRKIAENLFAGGTLPSAPRPGSVATGESVKTPLPPAEAGPEVVDPNPDRPLRDRLFADIMAVLEQVNEAVARLHEAIGQKSHPDETRMELSGGEWAWAGGTHGMESAESAESTESAVAERLAAVRAADARLAGQSAHQPIN